METEEGFRISVHNEDADFLRLLWRLKKRTVLLVCLIVVAISTAFALTAFLGEPVDPSNDRRWVVYILPILLPLVVLAIAILTVRGQVKKMRECSDSLSVYFSEDGIELEGRKATSNTKWPAFHKVVETPTDFIFYLQANICYGIPKRFFDSSSEIDRLRGFLRKGLGEKAVLRSDL